MIEIFAKQKVNIDIAASEPLLICERSKSGLLIMGLNNYLKRVRSKRQKLLHTRSQTPTNTPTDPVRREP